MSPTSEPPPLEVYLLGLVDYLDAQKLQRRLVYDLGESGGAALILCEHSPTISVGRAGSRNHIAVDDQVLRSLGVEVYWVNRGGGCVLHQPGQVVAYLAVSLDSLHLDVQAYLDGLQSALLGVLDEFDLKGTTRPDLPGIFLGNSRVASVGVAVNRWVAYHGSTLNVGPYLEPFELMIEEPGIGFNPLRQTSMEARRQRPTPVSKVKESIIRQVERFFNLKRHHIFTQHPMIRQKAFDNVYAQSSG